MRLIGFLSILLLGASLAACGERETSFEELLATAEAGDANAQYAVGIIYQEGRGVEKDLGKTIAWYEKAAAKGEVNALYTLGYMSHHGIGVAQNFDKAAQWYRAAGNKGHPKAMFELARLYMRGLGVERSFAEAVRWIESPAPGRAGSRRPQADDSGHAARTIAPRSPPRRAASVSEPPKHPPMLTQETLK